MSLTVLNSLFACKTAADRELIDRLATLDASQAAPLQTALRTLNHIHVVDRLFRARLAGEPEPYEATNTEATPTLARLRDDMAATDAWYEHHLSDLDPPRLAERLQFRFTDGDAGSMSREEILLHVITHGTYHRGNVGQVLKSIGIAPPRDLYTRHLHAVEPQRRASPAAGAPSGD